DAVRLGRLAVARRRPDRDHLLAHTQPAGCSEDQVARRHWRADGRLDVTLVENVQLPVLLAGFGIEAGDTEFVAGEDQLRRLALWLEDTGSGVGGLALAWHLPAHLAAVALKGVESAAAIVVGGDDEQPIVNDGRRAGSVTGLERSQVGPPCFLAGV